MDSSIGPGFMAVFAVSGSVVFLAMQVHKRLLSNFMKKMECEIKNSTGGVKGIEPKKKVRFAQDVVRHSDGQKNAHSRAATSKGSSSSRSREKNNGETLEAMPQNWQAMYKGILQSRNLRAYS